MVLVGVPYATHLWQVADSNELNGTFKVMISKAKRDYLKYRLNSRQQFVPTDIIPLVNTAWMKCFAITQRTKKGIIKCG